MIATAVHAVGEQHAKMSEEISSLFMICVGQRKHLNLSDWNWTILEALEYRKQM